MGGVFVLFWIVWLAVISFAIVATVLWVIALVEVLRYPDAVWAHARTDKTTWILVVVLAGGIGALIYWFSQRKGLKAVEADLAMRGMLHAPPQQAYGYGYGYPPSAPPQAPPPPPPAPGT